MEIVLGLLIVLVGALIRLVVAAVVMGVIALIVVCIAALIMGSFDKLKPILGTGWARVATFGGCVVVLWLVLVLIYPPGRKTVSDDQLMRIMQEPPRPTYYDPNRPALDHK